ncbi:universal stress protein [Zoogloea sp.]|uniref:universal stress protein n=1 Tax=Zoogloea sp. TaxID=49181 RepID=UPI0035B3406F
MKILLAVDDSPVALRVVAQVIALAGELKSAPDVHVLYVHPPIPIEFATRHVARETLDTYYRDEGEGVLKEPVARLKAAGLPVTPHIHVGQPADVVLHQAAVLECDYLCLGRHGRSVVADLFVGSVATRVLQRATLPVLLVG